MLSRAEATDRGVDGDDSLEVVGMFLAPFHAQPYSPNEMARSPHSPYGRHSTPPIGVEHLPWFRALK